MSTRPRRSSRLPPAAAAQSSAAASSASAGSKRRVDDAAVDSAATNALADQQHPTPAMMSDADAAPSSSLQSVSNSADAAPFAPSSFAAASSAVAHKRQKQDDTAAPATSAAITDVVAPSRWSRLYSDALHSILKFATLADLSRVLAVSRRWSAAVTTMPSIRATSRMDYITFLSCSPTRSGGGEQLLVARLRSRLARHVSSLRPRLIPSLRFLQLLSEHMPWIAELDLLLSPMCSPVLSAQALAHFAALRHLQLDLSRVYQINATDCNRLVSAVGRLPKLGRLELDLFCFAGISFAPLAQLHSLHTFHLDVPERASTVSNDQITELRSMTSVRTCWHQWRGAQLTEFLVRMLQPGHALQWTLLPDWLEVTAPLAPLLGSLSALTELRVAMLCPNVNFLSQLPQLTDLCVKCVDAGALVAALSHCTQLRKLLLVQLDLTDDHLAQLLPRFPQLARLRLHDLFALQSLRFLETPALSASLTGLTLVSLPRCPSSEVAHLLNLRALRQLFLWRLASPVSAELQAEFAVPSQRLPNLRQCIIRP